MKTALLLLMLLESGGFASATDAPGVIVRPLGRDEAGNPPIHLFGGEPMSFPLDVTAPLGSRLGSLGIYADLFQTSAGGLSIALSRNLPLTQPLHFDHSTHWIAPCNLAGLPAVKRPVTMLLRLYVRMQGQPATPIPVGSVTLDVYPRLTPADWKKTFAATLAQGGLARVALFGKGGALRSFLRRQQIPFDNSGSEWPGELDSKCLYLADAPAPRPDRITSLAGIHIALFSASDSSTLPGVYSAADTSGGSVVKVTLPTLFDHLDDDPRAQHTFLTIVRETLTPQAPADDTTSTWP